MSVRKRTWTNQDSSSGEAWVAAYTDHEGKRRIRSFDHKHEAAAFHATVAAELRSGIHVPDSQSVTVAEAGRLWFGAARRLAWSPHARLSPACRPPHRAADRRGEALRADRAHGAASRTSSL